MPSYQSILLLVAVLALVAVAVAVAVLAKSRRREVWRLFARRHGLRFIENRGRLVVAGMVRDRLVTLTVPQEGSDGEELGVEEVRLDVSLDGPLPRGFELAEGGLIVGEAERAFGEQVVETGDAEFDRRVVVKGGDAEAIRAYLAEDRRRALLDLLDGEAGWTVLMDEHGVALEKRSLVGRLDELEDRLEQLLAAAPRLDRVDRGNGNGSGKGTEPS
ncbi:MAG: hypothetical protein WD066_12575 [Planctomycetaceae bacterium]